MENIWIVRMIGTLISMLPKGTGTLTRCRATSNESW
jgi:hypothetical protein